MLTCVHLPIAFIPRCVSLLSHRTSCQLDLYLSIFNELTISSCRSASNYLCHTVSTRAPVVYNTCHQYKVIVCATRSRQEHPWFTTPAISIKSQLLIISKIWPRYFLFEIESTSFPNHATIRLHGLNK